MSRANPQEGFRRTVVTATGKSLTNEDSDTLYVTQSPNGTATFTLPGTPVTGVRFGFMRDQQNLVVDDNGKTIRMPWGDETGNIKPLENGAIIEMMYNGSLWLVTRGIGKWGNVGDTHSFRFDGKVGGTQDNYVSIDADGNIQDSGDSSSDFAAATHASQHQNGGGDEISVAGLSGVLDDAQTPIQHALDSTTYHSAPGSPTEDDFFLANASGLPKSGGFGLVSMWQTGPSFSRSSDSQFTVTNNAKNQAIFIVGRPIRYRQTAGTWRYGIVTAYSSGTVTIAGYPMTTSDDDEIAYGDMARVQQINFVIPGLFADAADNYLLKNDNKAYFEWRLGKANIVMIAHRVMTADSGANQPRVNVSSDGIKACSANSGAGRDVSTSWVKTVVDLDTVTGGFSVDYGDEIEVTTDANGTNNDAEDLSVDVTLVLE